MKRADFKIALLLCLLVAAVAWIINIIRAPEPALALEREQVPLARLTLKNGRLYRAGQTHPFNGIVTETYSDRSQKSRASVQRGKLNGLSEGWHTNGVLQVQENFVQGVSHGARLKWHSNGKKASEAEIEDGKLHGLFRRWNEDGSLAEEIQMLDGLPHGDSSAYYPSGFLKTHAKMNRGEVIERQDWKDGQQKPE